MEPPQKKFLFAARRDRRRRYRGEGLLDPHQFGFRPEHSTQTAILDLTETIRHAIDKHKVSLVVSFDFSKAFDSIPHTLIIKKLRLIGCTASALDWFASYLSGRSQAICLSDGSCSSFMTTTAGVPQGSVLGPLLFLVFINDLSARLSSSQHMIYADDTQIFCSDLPARAHILLDRSDISAIVAWAEDNGISLNSDKTGAMLCGSQFYVNALKESTPPLFVGDAQLQMMPELTILGLKLTLTLAWGPQVSRVCSSMHYTLYSLRYYRHALTRSIRKNSVESLIFPIFDYGSSVFHDLNKGQSLKLYRLHNACVRYVYGTIPYRAHVTPYRLALGWLSAQRRRDYYTIIFAINIITRQSPSPLANLFTFQANRLLHRAARRQPSRALTHKTARIQALHNSFAYATTRLINSLPFLEDPRHPPRALRQLVYAHLFELDVQDWKLRCYMEQLEKKEEGPEEATANFRKPEKSVQFQEAKERLESCGKVGGKTTNNRVQVRKATAGGGSNKGERKNTIAEDGEMAGQMADWENKWMWMNEEMKKLKEMVMQGLEKKKEEDVQIKELNEQVQGLLLMKKEEEMKREAVASENTCICAIQSSSRPQPAKCYRKQATTSTSRGVLQAANDVTRQATSQTRESVNNEAEPTAASCKEILHDIFLLQSQARCNEAAKKNFFDHHPNYGLAQLHKCICAIQSSSRPQPAKCYRKQATTSTSRGVLQAANDVTRQATSQRVKIGDIRAHGFVKKYYFDPYIGRRRASVIDYVIVSEDVLRETFKKVRFMYLFSISPEACVPIFDHACPYIRSPDAPHFGSLWEAAVKSFKAHPKRTLGPWRVTFEKMSTLLVSIKAVLNSRPLCPVTNEADDLHFPTPGNFLVGTPLLALPEQDVDIGAIDHLHHWQLIQALRAIFWKKWSREFLNTLQQRTKWSRRSDSLTLGDMVLLMDPALLRPSGRWPLGRVIDVHQGRDELVRSAVIKTAHGFYTRLIVRLVLLPIKAESVRRPDDDDDDVHLHGRRPV
ncbi:unnamed protein product [Trichogramma brassicae]|uniref:Reverse transcriptase domain-containing protein n=1 Tax=Trichogramma brassicae TaxID=86971 RepID=A0A6H5I7Y4_9HYME|nr:unnamed protein product [Trichogramma brassicae]